MVVGELLDWLKLHSSMAILCTVRGPPIRKINFDIESLGKSLQRQIFANEFKRRQFFHQNCKK